MTFTEECLQDLNELIELIGTPKRTADIARELIKQDAEQYDNMSVEQCVDLFLNLAASKQL